MISHYKLIADMMTKQAETLEKFGTGETTLLKGDSADAVRKRAHKSHGALVPVRGRACSPGGPPAGAGEARSETGTSLMMAEVAAARQD